MKSSETRFWSAVAVAASLLLPGALKAQGQTAVLTGTIKSEAGDPIENANVLIADLAVSVATNAAGHYTITVPAARAKGQTVTLMARAIGYKAAGKTVVLSAGSHVNDFAMTRDINRLSDIVTTGVSGATETKKLTFSVAHVDERDMPVPGANPLSQLQGKVAGANIVSASGRPGAAPAIILRAPQSLNASGRSQEPLLIIDGTISGGSIADINPQDIASVEVVKGAAASSIYGSRAGNGVIQITTKTGKNGPEGVRFAASSEYGQGSVERSYQYPLTHFVTMDPTYTRFCVRDNTLQSCARTVDLAAETYRINDGGIYNPLTPVVFQNDGGIRSNPGAPQLRNLYQVNPYPQTYNPINQLLTNGANINSTFSATGKINKTSFFTSINQYRNAGGIKGLRGYVRNSIRLNIEQTLPANLSFGIHSTFNDIVDHNNGIDWLGLTRQPASANLLAVDSKGRTFLHTNPQSTGGNDNPLYNAQIQDPTNKIGRYLADASLRWAPLTWFDADYTFGYDGRQSYFADQLDKNTLQDGTDTYLGFAQRDAVKQYSLNSSLSLTVRKSFFGDAINTRTNFRSTYEAQDVRTSTAYGENLAVPGLATLNSATTNFAVGSGTTQIRQEGYVLEFAPDYKGRYIATASVRRDAASLFGASTRWQTYGRGSLAWRIVDEPWFHVPGVTDLKLRASVGQAGNRPSYSAQYETFTIGTGGSLTPFALGNKNLKPEVSTETELGGDLELFNRYQLTLTHSFDVVKQQILPVVPPAAAGFATQQRNAGTLTNRTWEGSLNIPVILRKNLNYSIRIIADHSTSIITQLDIPEKYYSGANQQGAETMFKYALGGHIDTEYGRAFVKNCNELPAAFAGQCGGAGKAYQANAQGLVVYVGAGNSVGDGITKNLWNTRLTAANSPFGGGSGKIPQNWGTPILRYDSTGAVLQTKLGHALPDLNWSMGHTLSYKRFSAYGLLNAVVGKSVWNEERQWSFGDFSTLEGDQSKATVATAKPLGYYFRAASNNGIGGLYDILALNNVSVEDASFVKMREVDLSYRVGSVAGVGNWTVSVIGRNLKTWTKYKGFDPEVGGSGGALNSSVLNAIDNYQFPNLRTFSFSLSTTF
jgi:TonB-linked SusC/RagA family outer membrane protein